MSEAKDDYAQGDELTAAGVNDISEHINDGGGFRDSINGGETISGATTPVAVYQDSSDGELYACDADDQDKLDFIGFVISDTTDGNPADFQGGGVVRGFTGLTAGADYYVQDDKTIGTSAGTYPILVGTAISATELLIKKEINKIRPGTQNLLSLDNNQNVNSTDYTQLKSATIHMGGTIKVVHQVYGGTVGVSILSRVYIGGVAVGTERTTTNGSTTEYSENFSVNPGDNVSLYAKKSDTGGSGSTPYVDYMKIQVYQYPSATSIVD